MKVVQSPPAFRESLIFNCDNPGCVFLHTGTGGFFACHRKRGPGSLSRGPFLSHLLNFRYRSQLHKMLIIPVVSDCKPVSHKIRAHQNREYFPGSNQSYRRAKYRVYPEPSKMYKFHPSGKTVLPPDRR